MRQRLTRNNATRGAREHLFARANQAPSRSRRDVPATNSPSSHPAGSKANPVTLSALDLSRPSVPPRDLTTSQYGPLGRLIKRVVSLFLSYHTYHQDLVNASLAASFDQLAENQASLANALLGVGSGVESMVTFERQLDLVRSRLKRIGATLREHDERIDALAHLVEQLHASGARPHRHPLPGGDSILRFSLPLANRPTDVNLDGASREIDTDAVKVEDEESGSDTFPDAPEVLTDELQQALAAVRVLRQQIDDLAGEAARAQLPPGTRGDRYARRTGSLGGVAGQHRRRRRDPVHRGARQRRA